MDKFEHAEKIGLRDKTSKELIAVYPFKAVGTDADVEKMVRDWYYKQSCKAENQLLNAYVDVVNEREHEQKAKKR